MKIILKGRCAIGEFNVSIRIRTMSFKFVRLGIEWRVFVGSNVLCIGVIIAPGLSVFMKKDFAAFSILPWHLNLHKFLIYIKTSPGSLNILILKFCG